jgi:hypothetical protein
MGNAAVPIAAGILLVEPNGFGVVGNGAVVLSFGKMRKAAVMVGDDVVWIDSNCLIIVGYGSIIFAFSVVVVSTTIE